MERELQRLAQWDTAEKNLAERVQDATTLADEHSGIQTRSQRTVANAQLTQEEMTQEEMAASTLTWMDRMIVSRLEDSFPELVTLATVKPDWKNGYEKVPLTSYKDIFNVPESHDEAWNNPDPWQRDCWRKAIAKEFTKMEERKVWKKVPRSSMPEGRRCVKHKWVFDIKRNGIFRARLVAKGFSQIPGVDYTEAFSPVSNDVTFRIMLLCAMRYGWVSLLMDVETAFLLSELKKEIHMECPEGMETKGDEVLLLLQTIYGLVQSAREFFKFMVNLLKRFGFEQSAADPCLLVHRNDKGTVMISLYVDDCYVIGDKAAMDEFVEQIKGAKLTVKWEHGLKDERGTISLKFVVAINVGHRESRGIVNTEH